MTWAIAAAAVVLVAIGLFVWRDNAPQNVANTVASAETPAATPDELPQDDRQLLQQVAATKPDLRAVYESNLRNVNTYIRQVRLAVERDPADTEARAYLMQAYAQKAMLYEMAVSRSME